MLLKREVKNLCLYEDLSLQFTRLHVFESNIAQELDPA